MLLNIFRYYLDASPRLWPRLAHICRKWRHIVFTFQQALHLRLFCKPGTPVSKTLDCWPPLPIVLEYGSSLALDSPAPEDEVNMIAVLKQSDRVSSITLTVTTSLLDKLYTIERPFLELEDLTLLSRDSMPLTLPSSFRWGPCLRRLHLTRIALPAIIHLLYSSTNLVDLQLREALDPQYLSMDVLANALSGMAQLRSLSLHFPSITHSLFPSSSRPNQRFILPALTRLDFRGISESLERLVLRIDAPRLRDIQVALVDKFSFFLSTLGNFIDRIEMHKSPHQASILSSEHSITISLTRPGVPTCFKLQLLSQLLSEQLSAVIQILLHSAYLLNVEDLRISATRPPTLEDNLCRERWSKLINSFKGIKWLHLDENTTDIVRVLQDDCLQHKTVPPALHKLYLPHPGLHHAPLSKAVVSFMSSRWRSGYPIGVEYERLCRISEQRGTGTVAMPGPSTLRTKVSETGPFSEPMTVDHEMLCDDILLNIFRQYLDTTPRLWPTLTHICRRWQQVILRSPLGLRLRLYCTYGTPVLKTLDCWPPLPLVVNYGGYPMLKPPATKDNDNIITALKHSDRVNAISLTLTKSLLEKLSTISEPFSELEELVLLSQDKLQLTLPNAFGWGERIRTLHVTGIAIPTLPRLLSSTYLVDIQLHEIPMAGYFSPQAFANALSGASHLGSLSLHFLSFPPRRSYVDLPAPGGHRIVLPALTCFKYRGISKYLDNFVAGIDAPHLRDIDITFFHQPTVDASQLGQFIERIGIKTVLREADIQADVHAVSISFKTSSTSTRLRLQIPCKQLDWQLSSMTQVCDQISPFLFGVQHLVFNTNDFSSEQDEVDDEQWVQLIRSFGGTRTLSIAGEFTTRILCALQPADEGYTRNTPVLPALRNLRVRKPGLLGWPFWDRAQTLVTSRGLSGHPKELWFECPRCDDPGFTSHGLKEHLLARHSYETVCSYCDHFQFPPEYIHQLQEHLRSKHPEVVQNDALISQPPPTLTPLQTDTLAYRHSSLREPWYLK